MAIKIQNGVVIDDNKNFIVGAGDTASRPTISGSEKVLRFNTDNTRFEGYNGSGWENLTFESNVPFIQDSSTWTSEVDFTANNGQILDYVSDRTGNTYVFVQNDNGFELVQLNFLGEEARRGSAPLPPDPAIDFVGMSGGEIDGVYHVFVAMDTSGAAPGTGLDDITDTFCILFAPEIGNQFRVDTIYDEAIRQSTGEQTSGIPTGGTSYDFVIDSSRNLIHATDGDGIFVLDAKQYLADLQDSGTDARSFINQSQTNSGVGVINALRLTAPGGSDNDTQRMVVLSNQVEVYELEESPTTEDLYYSNPVLLGDQDTGAPVESQDPDGFVDAALAYDSADFVKGTFLLVDSTSEVKLYDGTEASGTHSLASANLQTTFTPSSPFLPRGTISRAFDSYQPELVANDGSTVTLYRFQIFQTTPNTAWTYNAENAPLGPGLSAGGGGFFIAENNNTEIKKIRSIDGTDTPQLETNVASYVNEFLKSDTVTLGSNTVSARELNVATNGTSGQVLASDGDGSFSWVNAGGATLTDDTTTSTTQYVTMSRSTSGSHETAFVSSTKLFFDPSTGELSATNFNSLSDASLKENVQTITNGLDVVNQINPVSFNWKDSGKAANGVIAQELEQILPEVVSTGPDGTKSVSYDQLIAFLVDAVQKLDERTRS